MRRAFAETLVKMAQDDSRVIFLTGDLGFQVFDEFEKRFGPRYINVGVAEAQMVCASAGLAATGWRPICYSIASFATNRAFEQIRLSVNYHRLPVIVVGAGGGYAYAASGLTHHAVEDWALMSVMPGMTVVAPGDPDEVRQLLPQLLKLDGPAYVRMGGFGEPVIPAEEPVILGKWRLMRKGEKLAVVSAGDALALTHDAMTRLAAEGIRPQHYQIHTIKPLDVETLSTIANKFQTIVVIEEHIPTGGLYDAVCRWSCEQPGGPRLIRLGVPDELALGNPGRETVRKRLGYDADAIVSACRRCWGKR